MSDDTDSLPPPPPPAAKPEAKVREPLKTQPDYSQTTRQPRRSRHSAPPAPTPSRSFAERQAALGTPINPAAPAEASIKVAFVMMTGEKVQLNRGAFKVATGSGYTSLPAYALPRIGDRINAGGSVFGVAQVTWSYTATGTPTATVYVKWLK